MPLLLPSPLRVAAAPRELLQITPPLHAVIGFFFLFYFPFFSSRGLSDECNENLTIVNSFYPEDNSDSAVNWKKKKWREG